MFPLEPGEQKGDFLNRLSCNDLLKVIFLYSVLIVFATGVEAQTTHLYTTGASMEIDRCASAWLIKRYVDQEAVFQFFPEESLITTGIVFDRPEGSLHRTHNRSTFEVIAEKYGISFPGYKRLAARIHDAEVNFWGGKQNSDSGKMIGDLKEMMRANKSNAGYFKQCFSYFDHLLQKIQGRPDAP